MGLCSYLCRCVLYWEFLQFFASVSLKTELRIWKILRLKAFGRKSGKLESFDTDEQVPSSLSETCKTWVPLFSLYFFALAVLCLE